ncbi:MAG: gamma carbonic anhydrase family protein [Rhizomicrobium sp.]|jgi:carbonic anhydrase/acetyltransferase-like protein (isoleucine patch superfamily)
MPIYALEDATPELPPEGEFWVAPNAILIGRVRLLKGASVWWGCVLRGDNDWITVGENSNVQDLSVIHTDPGQPVTIGSNCTVGHRVILHSTTIGDGSLIGMGSTLLNRSRIGSNSLIGANTLVTEGKEFPDGSMILGSPARVARKLGEMELTMLKMSSAGYVHNHRRFREKLRQIG